MHSSALISGLLSLVAVVTSRPTKTPQARDDNQGCTAASTGDFKWTLQDFKYNASWTFSTPSHQIASGVVDFQLTNPALTYPVICHAVSSQLQDFFYGTVDYSCALPDGVDSSTTTTFSFNTANRQVKVSQKWYCSDVDPKYPITFNFAGDVNLTTTCKETTYQNPDWQMGEIYSSKFDQCTSGTVAFVPTTVSAVA